jgi:hypothetical protein
MLVEELIAHLRMLPPTARVVAAVRMNESYDGKMEELYEWREADIDAATYVRGEVVLQLDE